MISKFSVDDFLKFEKGKSANDTLTSPSWTINLSCNVISRPIQSSSSSRTGSTSTSICASFSHCIQPNSSTPENFSSSLSDTPISLRPFSGNEASFTVHSYQISTHLKRDQESVSPLGAFNVAELPYHSLDKNFRLLTSDRYHYPLRLDYQIFIHPRQYLRYHILHVCRRNSSLQYSTKAHNGELTRLAQNTAEITIEVTVMTVGLNRHPIPTSFQSNHWFFWNQFVVTSLHYTSTDEPPFDHQWGCITV